MNKRDPSHKEQIRRWAEFVRENPNKWKKHFKEFSDSQLIIAQRFYKKLAETEDGRKKIKLLKEIKC